MTEAFSTRDRLRLAFAKLKRDAGPEGKGPSISAVARAAGVSHTLVHTKYPEIADEIRRANGRAPEQVLEKRRDQLAEVEDRLSELRKELADVKTVNRGLASENAKLHLIVLGLKEEIVALQAGARPLRPRKRGVS